MHYNSWLECTRGCGERHSIFDVVYRCETCGGLLDVEHDMDALRDRSPAGWMQLFERRTRTTEWPYGSGVWGKKEWVCPELSQRERRLHVRGTHQLLLGRAAGPGDRGRGPLGQALRQQPHGLVQRPGHDRARLGGQADDRRRDSPIRAVACASTGDTSAALAAYGAAAGIPASRLVAQGQGLDGPAHPAHRQRRARAGPGYRLRRLHAHRQSRSPRTRASTWPTR